MTFILYGFKASGKTYFGKKLAALLKLPHIDTDKLIEERYQVLQKETLSCREIFIKEKEVGFRALEKEVIGSLNSKTQAIISVGGGAVLDKDNQIALKKIGKLIYLEQDKETLKKRLGNGLLPPFLQEEASFDVIYNERTALYKTLYHYKITFFEKEEKALLEELFLLYKEVFFTSHDR